MLAVLGVNTLRIILNLLKLDRTYNAQITDSQKWRLFCVEWNATTDSKPTTL
jgi:hypothetical protein